MNDKILRWPQVEERTGLSRTTVWRLIAAGDFPPAQKITKHAVGWRESEVAAWVAGTWAKQAA